MGEVSTRPPVPRSWLIHYGLLYFGQNIQWAAPVQILLGLQILEMFPDNKENALALLMTIGGIFQAIGSLAGGFLSDRTHSRFGKRLPWILGGNAVAITALLVTSIAPSYILLVVAWSVFQVALAIAGSSTISLSPDTVPRYQFGLVSGVLGATNTLGVVGGTLIAASLEVQTAYLVIAVLAALLVGQFAVSGAWKRGIGTEGNEADLMLAEGNESTAEGYGDFRWVFIARFAINLGNYVALFYLLYYMRDRIGHPDPDTGVLILTGVYAVCTVITTILGGIASDRVGRRKPFVILAATGVTTACVLMAIATDMWMAVVGAVILGVAWGVFTSVDQALVNEVLPVAKDRARDVGIMTLAIAGANIISPMLAAFALANLGGYPGLYLASGALVLLGSLAVIPVKSAR